METYNLDSFWCLCTSDSGIVGGWRGIEEAKFEEIPVRHGSYPNGVVEACLVWAVLVSRHLGVRDNGKENIA